MSRYVQQALEGKKTDPPPSREAKRFTHNLERLTKALDNQLEYCYPEQSEMGFIDITQALSHVIRAQDHDMISMKSVQPQPVFRLANLAKLASSAISYSLRSGKAFLAAFDKSFPGAFIDSSKRLGGQATATTFTGTFKLGLEMRTQLAIDQLYELHAEPNFDQDGVILEIFYKDKNENELRGWDQQGFHGDELSKAHKDRILRRIQEIQDLMADGRNHAQVMKHLQDKYNWESCAYDLMSWIARASKDTELQVELLGGVDRLVQNSSQEAASESPNGDGAVKPGVKASRHDESDIQLHYSTPSDAIPQESAKGQGRKHKGKVNELRSGPFKYAKLHNFKIIGLRLTDLELAKILPRAGGY